MTEAAINTDRLWRIVLDYDRKYRLFPCHKSWEHPEPPALVVWEGHAVSFVAAWSLAQQTTKSLAGVPCPDPADIDCDVMTKVAAIREWKAAHKTVRRRKKQEDPEVAPKEPKEPESPVHWTETDSMRARVYRAVRDAGVEGITYEELKQKLKFPHRSTVVADLACSDILIVKDKVAGRGKNNEVNRYIVASSNPQELPVSNRKTSKLLKERKGLTVLHNKILDVLRASAPEWLSVREIADRVMSANLSEATIREMTALGLDFQIIANTMAVHLNDLCRWKRHADKKPDMSTGRKRNLYTIGDGGRTETPYYHQTHNRKKGAG